MPPTAGDPVRLSSPQSHKSRWPYVAVAAFVALIHALWVLAGNSDVPDGNLVGIDGYIRLTRIAESYQAGNWFDPRLARAGAPDGIVLHWTRLLDGLIIALALLMKPFLGFKAALYWSGALISPLLHIFTALALAWAAMPLLRRADAFAAGALTVVQAGLMAYAVLGHADHHVLFALTTALALGFAFRTLTSGDYRRWHGIATGVALAAGIWVGPEAVVLMALCLLVAGLPWIAGEDGWAVRNLHITIGLTGGLALIILIERGPFDLIQVEYDRVSVVHLTLSALLWTFWCLVYKTVGNWKRAGAALRLTTAVTGGVITVGVLWLLFPKIMRGPLADVDPAFMALSSQIGEGASLSDVSHFLIFAGGALFTVPWVLWRIRQEWRGPPPWPWILLACGLFISLALTMNWIRVGIYLGLFISVVLADLIGRVDETFTLRTKGIVRIVAKVSVIFFLAVGPTAVGIAGLVSEEKRERRDAGPPPACPLRPFTRFLNKPPWDTHPRNILASGNFGPEILYRTRHSVVATVHHRNDAGVLDSIRILGGGDETESLRLIRRRRIDLILLCPGSRHDRYMAGVDNHTLYRRLVKGDTPAWLRRVTLPPDLGSAFQLFQVVGPSARWRD